MGLDITFYGMRKGEGPPNALDGAHITIIDVRAQRWLLPLLRLTAASKVPPLAPATFVSPFFMALPPGWADSVSVPEEYMDDAMAQVVAHTLGRIDAACDLAERLNYDVYVQVSQ